MFRLSTISLRLFLMLLLLIGSIFGASYLLSVPLIKNNVFALELNANRQVLNVVYDLANRISFNSDTYIERTLAHHEQRLRSIVELSENYIQSEVSEGRAIGKSEQEIWPEVFASLRKFKFGHDDYIWAADYKSRMLAHPSNTFHNRDMSDYTDPDGSLVIPRLIRLALDNDEGFYKYKWYRLNDTEVIDKYSFVKHLPQWGVIIGAGVYIDDVEKEIKAQKTKAIEDISHALEDIKIGSNGYLYIFDSQGNMLLHPNPNIHGKNFKTLLNPVTGHPIYQDLMEMADTGQELYYKWDRPDDQGNYSYEKLALTRHLPDFDWYISSSVYHDDLKASSIQLSQRILAIGFFGLLAGVLAAFIFAKWITAPLKKLSLTAHKISRGNLTAKTGIQRHDELGVLAESFDYMVDRLRDNINTLNLRVDARTRDLSESNIQLLDAVKSLEATQAELRAVETRQRLILNALPAQVGYMDSQQRFIFANREYLEMFGETKETIVGKRLEEVIGSAMYGAIKHHIEQAFQGEKVIYEFPLTFEGREILTRRTLLPFYDDEQNVVGLLNLSIDITNERETEKRLAEASKMKAVGQMSGGLAHDFNNLLTIILGNLLEMKNNQALPTALNHNLVPAIRATRRGADMTRRLLAFSRRQPLSPSYIHPQVLISEFVDLLSAPLPDNIRLSTQVMAACPPIYVDAAQMEDALVNMALNAADAMPSGGEVVVRVFGVCIGHETTQAQGFDEPVASAEYVQFSIIDNGEGFTEEALKKAYEPFFTTKQTGAGSGLGLSMVFGFVKQSNGYIRIRNNEAGGAQIDLLLPAVKGLPLETQLSEGVNDDPISTQTNALVLLVEDNRDVGRVVRQQLMSLGYSVMEAASADEALSLLKADIAALSGVVSDVVMPGKASGYEVVAQVRAQYPAAFTLLMTGYSEQSTQTDFDNVLLQKPFDAKALSNAISAGYTHNSGHNNE